MFTGLNSLDREKLVRPALVFAAVSGEVVDMQSGGRNLSASASASACSWESASEFVKFDTRVYQRTKFGRPRLPADLFWRKDALIGCVHVIVRFPRESIRTELLI